MKLNPAYALANKALHDRALEGMTDAIRDSLRKQIEDHLLAMVKGEIEALATSVSTAMVPRIAVFQDPLAVRPEVQVVFPKTPAQAVEAALKENQK